MTAPVGDPAVAARAQLAAGRWPSGWTDREAALAVPALVVLDRWQAERPGQPVLVRHERLAAELAAHASRGVVGKWSARSVVRRLTAVGVLRFEGHTPAGNVYRVLGGPKAAP